MMLPATPLQGLIQLKMDSREMTIPDMARQLGVSTRQLQRVMAADEIGHFAADHICIRFGLHPALIWPREWCSQWPATSRKSERFPETNLKL